MSLQPFRPVDRRSSWRERIPLWDRETFQPLQIGHIGSVNNATVAFALFREDECWGWHHCWRDYGWFHPWTHKPVLSVSTDDGTGFLSLEVADPASYAILNVPSYYVGAIRPGRYRAAVLAIYADGTVMDLGSDIVMFQGERGAVGYNQPLMAGGSQPAGIGQPIGSVSVAVPPTLPTGAAYPVVPAIVPTVIGNLTADALAKLLPLLPTTLPSTPGQPWNDGGLLVFS